MSRSSNCWGNAVAESFFKTLKSEIIYGFSLTTSEKHQDRIITWTECWYNKGRRHSTLQNQTIDEFWMKYYLENGVKQRSTRAINGNMKFPNLLCG